MRLPFFIARRYLFSKKSHNVINIISVVSACAIGIGALALIVILSVYNGFDSIVSAMNEESAPEIVIVPDSGKVIDTGDPLISKVLEVVDGTEGFISCPVVEESAYVQYGNIQTIARIKGVPDVYAEIEKVTGYIVEGRFELSFGDFKRAVVSEPLANELMLRTAFSTPLNIYFPSRTSDISFVSPWENLMSERVRPAGIIRTERNDRADLIYIQLASARDLLEYEESECNAVEIFARPETPRKEVVSLERAVKKILGSGKGYSAKNIGEQNETMFRMMRSERLAVYLILFFVIVIVSVNIFASLSMLIIEKKTDIGTYRTMGAEIPMLRRIFTLHGWLVCMLGAVTGLLAGLALCLLQMRYGMLRMPGNFIVDAYPVIIKTGDILIILAGIAAIGFIMSYIPTRSIKDGITEE